MVTIFMQSHLGANQISHLTGFRNCLIKRLEEITVINQENCPKMKEMIALIKDKQIRFTSQIRSIRISRTYSARCHLSMFLMRLPRKRKIANIRRKSRKLMKVDHPRTTNTTNSIQ